MTDTCVLHLMALECLLAQELDGDEMYLRLNGEKVWGVGRHEHMRQNPDKPNYYAAVNFTEGTRRGMNGPEPMPGFNANSLSWRFVDDAVIELFEADSFSSDDLIGRQQVSARDVGHGAITVHFERDGAKYALTYRVEAGA
jgi:hypothetical protein